MFVSFLIMALGGEYLCMQKELEPIEINHQRLNNNSSSMGRDIEMDELKVMEIV